jgi:beta-barrel assembly-enhancing protease
MRWIPTLILTIGLAVPGLADPFRPSIQQQIDLGKQAAEQIRNEEKVLPPTDPRVKELRRLGQQIIAQIPEKDRKDRNFPYSFDVIDSKEVNAFALPGGPVFFYTGMLDKMKTEDEVIGILGHEIVHVQNMHWANQYASTMKRKLGLIVVFSLIGANNDILNAADMLDDVFNGLRYSRQHESESDRVGYDLMTKAGYNPTGLVNVFKMLMAQGGERPPELLSTHPDTGNRVKSLEKKITDDKRKFPAMRPRKALAATGSSLDVTWQNGWPNLGVMIPNSGQSSTPTGLGKGSGFGSPQPRSLALLSHRQCCGTP